MVTQSLCPLPVWDPGRLSLHHAQGLKAGEHCLVDETFPDSLSPRQQHHLTQNAQPPVTETPAECDEQSMASISQPLKAFSRLGKSSVILLPADKSWTVRHSDGVRLLPIMLTLPQFSERKFHHTELTRK